MTTDMKEEYARLQMDFERKKYGKEIKLPPTETAETEPSGSRAGKRKRPRDRGERGERRKRRDKGDKREKRERETRDRRRRDKRPADMDKDTSWGEVVGLDSSKRFFKDTIRNNLKGGK
jgi:hypothetical protein